mgnify:CR=1 FL=1
MMLGIGKVMVHKAHGICTIKEILQIGGNDYYKLVPSFDEGMSIFVPISKEKEFLREVIDKNQADDLVDYMNNLDDSIIDDSKERRDSFHKKLSSGDLKEIAYMCYKLYLLKKAKLNSNAKFCLTDSVMFDKAQKMLFDELALAYKIDRNKIVDYIRLRLELDN